MKIVLISAALFLVVNSALFAEEVKLNEAELISYAAQKHHANFRAQTDKSKSDIANEYLQSAKLGDLLLAGSIKEDIDYKIASRQIAIEIWAQKFMQRAQVSDDQLKELYKKYSPKVTPSYKLRNILVKSDEKADNVIKTITSTKGKEKQLDKFKELAQSDSEDFVSSKNGGEIGWIDLNKLDPNIQASLKDKKAGDVFKADVANVGTQVLMIEEVKPEKTASFEEAKATLIQLAKQEQLNAEIKKLLDSK
ncbi:MAG: peptidyl-prolyl cis-trans isomerase [Sulfuricurvum sp.]|nr:peptidyl-prolyl cis-trans isomerase [Sulfuricurvum sp.]